MYEPHLMETRVCVCVQVWSKGKPELSSAQRPLPPQSPPRRDAQEQESRRTLALSLRFVSLTRCFSFCRDEFVRIPDPALQYGPQVQLQARPQLSAGRRSAALHEWKRISSRVQRRWRIRADHHTVFLQQIAGRRRRWWRDTGVSFHSCIIKLRVIY